jgi:hypothetical protein
MASVGRIAFGATGIEDHTGQLCHAEQCGRVISSVCPEADLLSIDVFAGSHRAAATDIALAIDCALNQAARVIFVGMATSHTIDRQVLEAACRKAVRSGAVVVAPVDNLTGQGYPATLSEVVGVAAGVVRDGRQLAWLGVGGIDYVCDGQPPAIDGQRADRENSSSYAAARCAGLLGRLWGQERSLPPQPILARLRQQHSRRAIHRICIGTGLHDVGGWRVHCQLRDKRIILGDRVPFPLGNALHVGRVPLCGGMDIEANVTDVGSVDEIPDLETSPFDTLILGYGLPVPLARRLVSHASPSTNILCVCDLLAKRIDAHLRQAKQAGRNVWSPRIHVSPVPGWYYRQLAMETPVPCLAIVSNNSCGRMLQRCRRQLEQVSSRSGDRLLCVTDMPEGHLAGFDLAVPISQMSVGSPVSLERIGLAIQHEVRRQVDHRQATAALLVITRPSVIVRRSGRLSLSPWTVALLGALSPSTIAVLCGPRGEVCADQICVRCFSGLLDESRVRLVGQGKHSGMHDPADTRLWQEMYTQSLQ